MKKLPLVLTIFTLLITVLGFLYLNSQKPNAIMENEKDITSKGSGTMDPANLDPSKFTTNINNKYFNLPIGRELTYEGQTEDGFEKIVISISGETREVMGVKTLVYLDRVWKDGELFEYTKDYLAQDDQGNVWYFGEDVNNYEDGELKDHKGSWIAGVDGALPGIWIKGNHVKGDSYKQEEYKGQAEDMRDVVSIGEPITIKMGSYKDCIKMYDWTPLDPESREHKDYCNEVGAMVLETDLESGDKIELVSVK